MTWKPIENYDGLYEVSDTGLVRSLWYGNKRILSPRKHPRGYRFVTLCKDGKYKHMLIHRLVAGAFIPNPLGLATVNHRDEDKTNNSVANLEWLSLADNDRYGTRNMRSALARGKPVCQLDKLGDVVRQFPSSREAGRQTGIAQSSIWRACNGKLKSAGGYVWRYA